MLRRSSCVVGSVMLALLAGSVRAETIYIDQQARPANGADVVLGQCGHSRCAAANAFPRNVRRSSW